MRRARERVLVWCGSGESRGCGVRHKLLRVTLRGTERRGRMGALRWRGVWRYPGATWGVGPWSELKICGAKSGGRQRWVLEVVRGCVASSGELSGGATECQ